MLKTLLAGAAALVSATGAQAETYAIQAGRVIVDAALTTSSMLAPPAEPQDARPVRNRKTGRQSRAIEQ